MVALPRWQDLWIEGFTRLKTVRYVGRCFCRRNPLTLSVQRQGTGPAPRAPPRTQFANAPPQRFGGSRADRKCARAPAGSWPASPVCPKDCTIKDCTIKTSTNMTLAPAPGRTQRSGRETPAGGAKNTNRGASGGPEARRPPDVFFVAAGVVSRPEMLHFATAPS